MCSHKVDLLLDGEILAVQTAATSFRSAALKSKQNTKVIQYLENLSFTTVCPTTCLGPLVVHGGLRRLLSSTLLPLGHQL